MSEDRPHIGNHREAPVEPTPPEACARRSGHSGIVRVEYRGRTYSIVASKLLYVMTWETGILDLPVAVLVALPQDHSLRFDVADQATADAIIAAILERV